MLPLVLCDTMGLESQPEAGLNVDDLYNIYKGRIADRYQVHYTETIRTSSVLSTLELEMPRLCATQGCWFKSRFLLAECQDVPGQTETKP